MLNFEKKALKNREMRIKFPDQPEKFMESEIDLYEALQVNYKSINTCIWLLVIYDYETNALLWFHFARVHSWVCFK